MKIEKGWKLALELADFDVRDPYEIEIQAIGDGITYH